VGVAQRRRALEVRAAFRNVVVAEDEVVCAGLDRDWQAIRLRLYGEECSSQCITIVSWVDCRIVDTSHS
jgi:hypothetical protein